MTAVVIAPKNKRFSLGRGLGDLLSDSTTLATVSNKPRELPIEYLKTGAFQPRRDINPDTLEELAASIRAQGILQPLLVRPTAQSNQYEIIAGERRWRAAQLAGLAEVPVFVREMTDTAAMAMGLIENIQRDDLNALEQALALNRLSTEFNLTHEAIAQSVGKSRASISNLMRLLQLEPAVKTWLGNNQLEMGHARALLALKGADQIQLAQTVIAKGLSVRATEQLVRQKQKEQPAAASVQRRNPDMVKLESQLADRLGARVQIQHQTQKGKGKLVVHYHTLDQLEGILEQLQSRS